MNYLYDGNGNVVALADAAGAITARYAYSPFGKLISAKGADTASCSFGFSSEYRDSESGLVYYNYRYLNPKLGRWMTRDKVGIVGGINIYVVVRNNTISNTDLLGLSTTYEYYLIRGNTPQKIKDQLTRHRWLGRTYLLNAQGELVNQNDDPGSTTDATCKPSCKKFTHYCSATAKWKDSYSQQVWLPELILGHFEMLSPDYQAKWTAFVQKIRIHEDGHVAINNNHMTTDNEVLTGYAESCSSAADAKSACKSILEAQLYLWEKQSLADLKTKQNAYHTEVGATSPLPW